MPDGTLVIANCLNTKGAKILRLSKLLSGVVLSVATFIAAAKPAFAHVKWFESTSADDLEWGLFFQPLPLTFVGLVLFATVAAGVLWRARGGRSFIPGPGAFGATDERRSAVYSLVPLILGVHVAVPLLVNGVQGNLFSPDNQPPGVWANLLGFAETFIALALFYGAFTRIAAAALAAVWFAGIPLVGLVPMLDNALFLGFAVFFFFAGRGPVSIDRMLFPVTEAPERTMSYAVPALRVGLGVSFIAVAFSEKFANLPLAQAFLDEYPLNFVSALGIPLPDRVFIFGAGSVELLLGLTILFNLFVREIVVLALVPVNLTLTVFDYTELVGHLPIYGILAVLLIWEPGRKNLLLWIRGLREGPLNILPINSANEERSVSQDPEKTGTSPG